MVKFFLQYNISRRKLQGKASVVKFFLQYNISRRKLRGKTSMVKFFLVLRIAYNPTAFLVQYRILPRGSRKVCRAS
jgi:hypothetical protein